MHEDHRLSSFTAKMFNFKRHSTFERMSICLWSDLLGFGSDFLASNWRLKPEQIQAKLERMRDAQKIAIQNVIPPFENLLILNDGVVKVFNIEHCYESGSSDMTWLTICRFFKNSIITHWQINELEKRIDLPGTRTIISVGTTYPYYFEGNIQLKDYFYNDKQNNFINGYSCAEAIMNNTIVYNPIEFQMNTAFSQAYILDSIGSSQNIKGNNVFIQMDLIYLLMGIAEKELPKELWAKTQLSGENILITFPSTRNDRYMMAFEITQPWEITYSNWKTEVARVIKFYPYDEPFETFSFDL